MKMKEKRRHQRVPAEGVVAYLQVDDMSASAIIENISAGGIFIRTARPMTAGTPVSLNLARSGLRKPLVLTGAVVSEVDQATAARYGGPPGMGIAFDEPDPDTERRLERVLKQLGLPVPLENFAPPEPSSAPPAPFLPPRSRYATPTAPLNDDFTDSEADTEVAGIPMPGRVVREAAPVKPVSFKLEVPKPAKAAPAEMSRLMNHIRGLLAQLAEVEEKLVMRNRQLVMANEEIEQLRATLEEKNKQIRVLLGAKPR